jgi:phosphoglycerate kinase
MRSLPDIRNVDVSGKRVIIRADLNVPMAAGRVTDRTRIARFAPTVKDITDRGASVVILTHLGRPEGEKNPIYSTRPLAGVLAEELGQEVRFVADCVGSKAEWSTGHLNPGEVVLLENLRFYSGETTNDRNFALRLSVHGDLYVNDAFSCAHRAHASTQAIAVLMPAYAGPSLMAEVEALKSALESPERPVAALVGGAKVSTKIDVLTNLMDKVDTLIIGGGMANTFLSALGHPIGRSLHEPDAAKVARDILGRAAARGCEIILPSDVVVAQTFAAHAKNEVVSVDAIPGDRMALDVGPATTARIIAAIGRARTLLWNGPLGAFEIEPFGTATFAVARAAAERSMTGRLVSIAGGGDTVAALNGAGVADGFSYVSTAGGAFLEWIEGKALPGIEILTQNSTSTRVA